MKTSCGIILTILLALTVRAVAQNPSAVVAGKDYIDTSSPGWVWSAMAPYDDSRLSRGAGRAGGPGSYGAYTFNGTGVAIYVMKTPTVDVDGRSHKPGRLRVLIDGNLKAAVAVSSTDIEYDIRAYEEGGLPPGNHVLQLEPDAGWAVIDGIKIIGGADAPSEQGAPAGSTTANPRKAGDSRQVLFYAKNQPLATRAPAEGAKHNWDSENTMIFQNNVTGFLSDIAPELVVANLPGDWGPQQVYAHSGNSAIRYSGASVGVDSYCGMLAYSVHVPVSKDTVLSYWILPQQENGRYVGVDLHCTDGTTLASTAATDQYGNPIGPAAGHGGQIPTYAWSLTECAIGGFLNGKTVDAIWIVYARNGEAGGPYRGYIDEIMLYNQ